MLINRYRRDFKEIFELNKRRIRECIGPNPRIEHFGSTSVPGLPGKGVIDIIIGFKDKAQLSAAARKLSSIGYFISKRGQRARGSRIFLSSRRGESGIGDVHLHLVPEKSEDFKMALMFRNRLRRDKALREYYIRIKREAARAAKGRREFYTELKSEFVEKVSKLS
jgi:GrpB-like predicted nucleotidyltransferase (UPF0157 family)